MRQLPIRRGHQSAVDAPMRHFVKSGFDACSGRRSTGTKRTPTSSITHFPRSRRQVKQPPAQQAERAGRPGLARDTVITGELLAPPSRRRRSRTGTTNERSQALPERSARGTLLSLRRSTMSCRLPRAGWSRADGGIRNSPRWLGTGPAICHNARLNSQALSGARAAGDHAA